MRNIRVISERKRFCESVANDLRIFFIVLRNIVRDMFALWYKTFDLLCVSFE